MKLKSFILLFALLIASTAAAHFVRSDQYNFIRHGVPSVIMSAAPEPGSGEEEIFKG